MRRLVACFIMVFVSFVLNAQIDGGLSWKPPFIPVTIEINRAGVNLKGDASIVTPIGTFSIAGSYNLQTRTDDRATTDPVKDKVSYQPRKSEIARIIERTVYVRENDFRASGSGFISYNKEEIDVNCLSIAFDVTNKLDAECLAFDFVFDQNKLPLIYY